MPATLSLLSKGHVDKGPRYDTTTTLTYNEYRRIPLLAQYMRTRPVSMVNQPGTFSLPFAYNIVGEFVKFIRNNVSTIEELKANRCNDGIREEVLLLSLTEYLDMDELANIIASIIVEKMAGFTSNFIRRLIRSSYDISKDIENNIKFDDQAVRLSCVCHADDTLLTGTNFLLDPFPVVPNESSHPNPAFKNRSYFPQSEADPKIETYYYGQYASLLGGAGPGNAHTKARHRLLKLMAPSEVLCRRRVSTDWYTSVNALLAESVKTLFLFLDFDDASDYSVFQSSREMTHFDRLNYNSSMDSSSSFQVFIKDIHSFTNSNLLVSFKSVENLVYFCCRNKDSDYERGLRIIVQSLPSLKTLVLPNESNYDARYFENHIVNQVKLTEIHFASVSTHTESYLKQCTDKYKVMGLNSNENINFPHVNSGAKNVTKVFIHSVKEHEIYDY